MDAKEYFKQEYGHTYNIPFDSIEAIKFATRYHQSKIPTVGEEYIRDKIGIIVDQTRFHDVRLDHILKQKEDLTDELVKAIRSLMERGEG